VSFYKFSFLFIKVQGSPCLPIQVPVSAMMPGFFLGVGWLTQWLSLCMALRCIYQA